MGIGHGVGLLVCLLLMLAGCERAGVGGMPEMQPSASAGIPPESGADFATELAGPGTYLPPLPTAVVILRPDDMERNRAFCRAAMQLPTVRQAEAARVVAANLIHTRWLVQIADVPAAHAADCDFLTGIYDYARAASLMASVRTDTGSFAGRGPFLMMIIPDRTGLHVAGLDGSGFGNEDMGRFIGGWGQALDETQRRIASAPSNRPEVARPGLALSMFDLVAAVLRTVVGSAAGLVTGVLAAL